MKKILLSVLFILPLLFLQSCKSSKELQLTPEQMKRVSTNIFQEDFPLVYQSALSLLASKGFIITNTDKESGVITAEKRTDKKTSIWEEVVTDESNRTYLTTASIVVTQSADHTTEVYLTLHNRKTFYYDNQHREMIDPDNVLPRASNPRGVSGLIQRPQTYFEWFEMLKQEIARKKTVN